jgi:hypothetical protein
MRGTRRDIVDTEWTTAQVWDYGKMTHDSGWYWYCCVPGHSTGEFMLGDLSKHDVTEHEDQTITVSPSILIGGQGTSLPTWHGFLEHGVWREA